MTSPNAIIRPAIGTTPCPIESRKTRTPPTIAMRLAATEVSAMTSTPGPIYKPRAGAWKAITEAASAATAHGLISSSTPS
jgi:hypothetical protein